MTSRARRLRDRQRLVGVPRPSPSAAASDEVPGLGRVEQLLLRGDGLTTTSLEILTGDRINVTVQGHWHVTVYDPATHGQSGGSLNFDQDGADLDGYLATGVTDLNAAVGDVLLVREVLLVGPQRVHGSAELVALLRHLPPRVADALAATDQPIGRLLRDDGIPITRELRRWGFLAAGSQARQLDPALEPGSPVLGRTYVMRLSATGEPMAALTERFSPRIFAGGAVRGSG